MTKIQIHNLVIKLREEKHFLKKRITEANIEKAFIEHRVAFKINATNNQYCACCILWPTKDPYMFELGTLHVDESFRGLGYGKSVFAECMELLPKGAGMFLITREVHVLQLARGFGWQLERSNWTKSKFWTRIAEPWDRWEPGHSEGALLFFMP